MEKSITLPSGHICLVDDDDFSKIMEYSWWINKAGYVWRALRKEEGKGFIFLHRFIMSPEENTIVHHKNENKLDNRKINLMLMNKQAHPYKHNIQRFPTLPKNCKYKGVHFETARGRWKAMIYLDGKPFFLGRFESPELAALAYNQKALRLFGPLAYLNDVPAICDFENRF